MAERLHPGVYIQEISSGVRPIEGVSTSTTAFVGRTLKGNIDRPELVTSFAEFQASYGDFIAAPAGSLNDNYLPHAALQYFNNGGKRLYVARVVTGSTTPADQAVAASVTPSDRQGAPVGSGRSPRSTPARGRTCTRSWSLRPRLIPPTSSSSL